MENILQILFSMVYGKGTKDHRIANQIYEMIRNYLAEWKDNPYSIYDKQKDPKSLLSLLPTSKKDSVMQKGTFVKFVSQYGCALLISKQKNESAIKVQIIVPEEWATGSTSSKSSKLQYCSPKNQSSIYTPELSQYEKPLNQFLQNFDNNLFAVLESIKQKSKKQPSQIQKAVKMILTRMKNFRSEKKKKEIPQDDKSQEQNEEDSQQQKDVTPISKNLSFKDQETNTAWYVIEALLRKIFKDRYGPKQGTAKYEKLLIGFKASILSKVINQKFVKKVERNDTINFKKCLDNLIYSYKYSVSLYTKNHQKFLKIIRNLQKQIIEANGGRLNSQIFNQQYKEEQIDLKHIGVPKIIKPQKIKYGPKNITMAKIEQYNYEIDYRLPFQFLLNMFEEINNISEQKKEKRQQFLDHWVSLTQKTLFEYAHQIYQLDEKKPYIDLRIHMRQIQCEFGAANICKLAQIYEQVIKSNQKYYGMGMIGQARSHVQLVKTICAVVAFQSVKMNREKKKSNLNNYKVPIDIDTLYKNFISHDFLARRAIRCLQKYQSKRSRKNPLFDLNGSCSSFSQFGKAVGQDTRSAHIWLAYMRKIIDLEKEKIALGIKKEQLTIRLKQTEENPQLFRNINWKISSYSIGINEFLHEFSQQQKWLYAFVNNIPPDILGLIKISMIAQNPEQGGSVSLKNNQFELLNSIESLNNEQLPVKIHNLKTVTTVKSINSSCSDLINSIPTKYPNNNIRFVFGVNNSVYKGGFRAGMFEHYDIESLEFQEKLQQKKQAQKELKKFLKPPSDKLATRQHDVYAKLYLKPKNIEIQQFIALCTTRAAEQTQIVALCSNILQRNIIANCYDIGHKFKQELFLQTAGQIFAYKPQTEKHFGMIKKILQQFINVWVFSDTNFCPILGPFLAYLAAQLKDYGAKREQINELRKISLKLVKKCWEEFERGERQLKDDPSLKIQWDQRFIITAAICCFRQMILTQEDKQQLVFLAKLIFQFRISKIFSGRQQKSKEKRKFEEERAYSITRAIFKNIKVLSQFLIKNPTSLNQVLRQSDQGFPQHIDWQKNQIYQFIGKSKESSDVYQIDLYRGYIYKNGKQLSALDPEIKQKENYIKIFGKQRQFQVYPSNDHHFVRTKNNLNHQFKIDPEIQQIYFQFSEDGKIIRYISKRSHKDKEKVTQFKWQLIENNALSEFLHIPAIFMEEYLAWICVEKNCIVFRKTNFEYMYDIGLIIHLKNYTEKQFQIQKAFHVVFHGGFQNQNSDQIFDIKNQKYQEMILRSKQKKLNSFNPYKYLEKIQKSKFVFELKNQKTHEIYFLLYRYKLRFMVKGNKLISESHYGYQIDCSYYHMKQCLFNLFPCLVLLKDPKNQMILNSHHRILIVSDGKIQQDKDKKNQKSQKSEKGSKIHKSTKAIAQIDSYRYDIHDFFGDIRGPTRQSQLHLVCLMLSIDDNIRLSSMEMTPLQYAMHSLKTCFTNRPFNKKQIKKLKKIFDLANSYNFDEGLLLCEALWKGSKKLKNILPFQNSQKFQFDFIKDPANSQALLRCRTLYNKKVSNRSLNYRLKINPNLLQSIGFIVKYENNAPSQPEGSSDDQFQKEGFWKGIKQYNGQGISQQCDKINEIYKNICVNTKIFDFWKKQYPIKKEQNQFEKFPETIQQNANHENKSLMMKQLVEQLRNSYECFIKQQLRLIHVIEEFKDNNKKKNLAFIKTFISECLNCLQMIQQLIDKVKKQNEGHPDIISGYRPTLSQVNYTRILCYEQEIYAYYPQMKKQAADKLKLVIKIWMDLQTRIASYRRVEVLLQSQKVDIVALLREIGSPREQIFEKTEWVCFETEMKIQIWPSQLETYNNLMKNTTNGPFCQLNMGEGKTQVIIPMIVLNTIFKRKETIPRINLLTSLYEQARGNMFRFLSVTGFQIPGFQIPFKRQVQLTKHNIYKIRDLMNSFQGKAYILVNRQSRLSQILRFNQLALVKPQLGISLLKMPLLSCKLFDIFDEIDALMTSKKSYIFSIGNQIQLPSSNIRLQIMKQFIQIFLTKTLKQLLDDKMATTDQTVADALQVVRKGQYPDGLRLTLQNINQVKIKEWRNKIAQLILRDPNRHQYSFIRRLTEEQIANIIRYCTDPLVKSDILSTKIYKGSRDQIYILRGILAYGIFQHCLSKRCGVDYGVPGKQHKKRIAVPYEAADIPSKTSQYQHPEVSVLLSYVAYSMTGLTEDQFNDCLKALLLLTNTSMETQYEKWVNILAQQDKDCLKIQNANQINFISKAHRDYLFNLYGKNRMTIAFWLNKCIFPRDLKQYKQNICSSSFDLADVKQSIGFSGTMDNHWILPNKIKFSPCQTPSIRGTDGKMIYLATKYTKDICVIVENEKPLWQRFVDLSLEKKVSCIIDVGAICVGKSLKNEIVPWIAQHEHFDSQKFAGISFCDENGKWQIYDIETKYYINRGTTIPDHLTFVIFDQARTRGADLKMDENIVAAMSLGPDLTKDKFMQAAGRLRKLGRNQSIVILATHQVFSTLPTFPKQIEQIDKRMREINKKQLIQLILAWCCHNTIKQNENLLLQYSNLGWKYICSKVNKKPQPQQISSELEYKYEDALKIRMVSEISQTITSQREKKQIEDPTAQHFCQILQKYGKNVPKQSGALDDVCQRQVQVQKEQQKEQQNGFNLLQSIAQADPSKSILQIKDTPYKFDKQFFMTTNFINTTKQLKKLDKKLPDPLIGSENELPSCYFVKYNEKQFILISLREASLFIKQKVLKEAKDNVYKIALYNQLSLNDEYIKLHKLGGALVCAKFIAGIQNYSIQQQQYLIQLFKRSLQNNKQEDKLKSYENIVSMILRMRRIYRKKYTGSTLQKMIIALANQEMGDENKK